MKVLLVNKYHHIRGGSETYHFTLAELLRNQNHEVIFFSMRDDKNFPCAQAGFFVPHIDYMENMSFPRKLCVGLTLIYSWDAKRRMRKLLDTEKPDIVHVNLLHRQLTFSVVDEIHKRGIPILYTMHDYICICPNCTMLSHGKLCEECLQKRGFLPCIQKSCIKESRIKSLLAYAEAVFLKHTHRYDKIDHYIAPSRYIYDKHLANRFTKSPITFLRNFLPQDTVYQAKPQFHGYLLYFGRLSAEKGILTLLEAMKQIPDIQLHIAGDGPLRKEIEEFIQVNTLNERAKILGFLQKGKMQKVLTQCKAVVVPSEWYENCPYSIMESQAIGKPIIGTNIGGIPELIEDGRTGFVAESQNVASLAQAIRRLAALDQVAYQSMCQEVVSFACQNYSDQEYASSMIRIYQDLIDQRSQ